MSTNARFTLFKPILAGATLRERLQSSLGALVGIGLTGLVSALLVGRDLNALLLVPPMGASAVLVFAVPSSPMAQPWPAIGGNIVSACVGMLVAHFVGQPALAAGLAVGGAIAAMSLLRCLHPPGGAAALVALFAGTSAGYLFPLVPVGLNAVLLVVCGWLYHRLCHRPYPHVQPAKPAAAPPPGRVSDEDVDAALAELGETFDIDKADLQRLLGEIEKRALARSYLGLTCADLMTRAVVTIDEQATPDAARAALAAHDFRVLPVLDAERRVTGSVGLRELARPGAMVREVMSEPALAAPERPAVELIDRFAHGIHAVYVVDAERRPLGVVTEADWLAVLAKGLNPAP